MLCDALRSLYPGDAVSDPAGFAEFSLSFVQSVFEYRTDLESHGIPDYISYPVETLVERGGDCEDASLLYVAIMLCAGYDAGLFIFKNHVMAAICIPEYVASANIPGCELFSIAHNGKEYLACETTPGEFIPVGFIVTSLVGNAPEALLYI